MDQYFVVLVLHIQIKAALYTARQWKNALDS